MRSHDIEKQKKRWDGIVKEVVRELGSLKYDIVTSIEPKGSIGAIDADAWAITDEGEKKIDIRLAEDCLSMSDNALRWLAIHEIYVHAKPTVRQLGDISELKIIDSLDEMIFDLKEKLTRLSDEILRKKFPVEYKAYSIEDR